MFDFWRKTRIVASIAVPAVAMVLSACGPTVAQTQYSDVPVLVAGEDEDKTTVKRSSDIFKRVLAELKHGMKRTGFRMVDEESVAVDLDWKIRDRRPKSELIQVAKLMTQSGKASHRVRALVLFRIHAAAKDLGGLTKVRTRIDGEIYDIKANEFIDTFEMPTQEYPAPHDCLQNKLCITEVVGKRAREIAGSLGVVLAKKLARYRDVSAGGGQAGRTGGSERPVTGGGRMSQGGSGHSMQTPYTVTLKYFERREALTIIGVMADEFPGYKSHTLMSADPAVRKYEYVTSATPNKMEEWLTILLADMNFNPDKEIAILIRGSEITVEKIVPTPDRPKSGDEKVRFK